MSTSANLKRAWLLNELNLTESDLSNTDLEYLVYQGNSSLVSGPAEDMLKLSTLTARSPFLTRALCIGSSTTSGNGLSIENAWPQRLSQLMSPSPAIQHMMWATLGGNASDSVVFSGSWVAEFFTAHADANTDTVTITGTGSVIELVYYDNSASFTYSLDGGGAVAVNPGGLDELQSKTVINTTAGDHTIVITGPASGDLWLVSVGFHSDWGFIVGNTGKPSQFTEYWDGEITDWYSTFGVLNDMAEDIDMGYDVGFLCLTAGDSLNNVPISTYTARMESLVDKMSGSCGLVVVVIETDIEGSISYSNYVEAAIEAANNAGAFVINLYAASGMATSTELQAASILAGDGLHQDYVGNTWWASQIYKALNSL